MKVEDMQEYKTIDPMFARNPKEAERLAKKHVAVAGCGSVGSAFADMCARSGIGRLTFVDPDVLAAENLGRHILSRGDVGKPKAEAVKQAIEKLNPVVRVTAINGKFGELEEKPDLIVAVTDSFACQAKVNDYALRNCIPGVFAGCWGEASVGEILFIVPGKTPCYQCYADFRKDTVEIQHDPRRYTDPDLDLTKLPGQAGLWPNILILTGFVFQVALGLLDPENERARLTDPERTLLLINISKYDSNLQPLAVTFGRVKKGCAVCDESKLAELGADLPIPALTKT